MFQDHTKETRERMKQRVKALDELLASNPEEIPVATDGWEPTGQVEGE